MKNAPDFLCIGPKKTASTWLHHCLSLHPDIYLTPKKELQYLWERDIYPNVNLREILKNSHPYYGNIRKYVRNRIKRYYFRSFPLTIEYIQNILWDIKYLKNPHTLDWYRSLFKQSNGRLTGDLSPQYAQLRFKQIERIKHEFPHLKILIFVRNPIERDWSSLKMSIFRIRNVEPEYFFENSFDKYYPRYVNKVNYVQMLNDWPEIFGKDNVLIKFFDELKADSDKFLNDILNFLGIDNKKVTEKFREKSKKQVNKGEKIKMPDKVRKKLVEARKEEIMFLHGRYPQYTTNWLEKYYPEEIHK